MNERRSVHVALLATLTAFMALAALVACTDRGHRRDLLAVARAFPAPSGWAEPVETSAAEPVCAGKDCVTVLLRWETADRPPRATVEDLMRRAGYDAVEVNTCEPRPRTTGSFPFCRATAKSEGAEVELTVSGPDTTGPPWNVTLRVR